MQTARNGALVCAEECGGTERRPVRPVPAMLAARPDATTAPKVQTSTVNSKPERERQGAMTAQLHWQCGATMRFVIT